MSGQIKTITEQIYHELREEILVHRWQPGEKLGLKMMQKQLGVSSTPIREALVRLQQDGLIDYQPNIGMSVIRLSEKDVGELCDMMVELRVAAMRLAFHGVQRAEMVQELQMIQRESAVCIRMRDTRRWQELSDRFHQAFYQYANNSRLAVAAEKIQLQLSLVFGAVQQESGNQVEIQWQHDAITDALASGNLALASDKMYQHERAAKEVILKNYAVYAEKYE